MDTQHLFLCVGEEAVLREKVPGHKRIEVSSVKGRLQRYWMYGLVE